MVQRSRRAGEAHQQFILTANIEASDGGKAIVAGNERVIRARLSDAKFFYETDLKTKLEDRLPKFDGIVFHEKLGTQGERIKRIERLAAEIAPLVGADVEKQNARAQSGESGFAHRSGRRIPGTAGPDGQVLRAGAGRRCLCRRRERGTLQAAGAGGSRADRSGESVAVALADKIDTLVGFWAIDEKPTGSKDPYALRRAALGVIRLVVENSIRLA